MLTSPQPDAVVIASHLPGEGHFLSDRFDVAPLLCVGDYDYWQGIADRWAGGQTLILIEHDIEALDGHLAVLLSCPHPLCTWLYRCHWASGFPRGGWAQRGRAGEWADRSGIGLVKIAPEARLQPLRREPWGRVELSVETAVKRPWHVHAPAVNHHHW